MPLDADLYLKTSPSLILLSLPASEDGTSMVGVYDFLTKEFATCPTEMLYWLSYFHKGKQVADAKANCSAQTRREIDEQLGGLVSLGFLTIRGSAEDAAKSRFSDVWEWETLASAFHFSVLNNSFMSLEESQDYQIQKSSTTTPPHLHWQPTDRPRISLPALTQSPACDHVRLLAQRRTNRTSAGHVLTKQELGDCLFGAFAVVAHFKTPIENLPLSLAPSGGARNPYEPFVLVQRCNGLQPGIYHYSGTRHELSFMDSLPSGLSVSDLLAGQDWTDNMAAIVFMVAYFERSMWKYQDANAYRVMLIEAGHRAQNLMTVATAHGLTACPTAALAHEKVAGILAITDPFMRSPIYAITLDKALPNQDKATDNPHFFAALYGLTPSNLTHRANHGDVAA